MGKDNNRPPSKFATCKTVSMTVVITSLVVACLTALIVGFAVFLWQDSRCEKEKSSAVEDAKEELNRQIDDLEEEINELKSEKDTEEEDTTTEEDSDTTEDSQEDPTPANGYIKGSLGYPSEYIPEMKVCAEDTTTGNSKCIDTAQNQQQYQLEVAPGSYYVYAMLSDGQGAFEDYKAYYSEFVTCGMTADCTSHDPIVVTVASGETETGIDPTDWYNAS